jgi:hypothetical protein
MVCFRYIIVNTRIEVIIQQQHQQEQEQEQQQQQQACNVEASEL